MRRNITILNIFLAVALIYAPVAAARQSALSGEWATLRTVPEGAELTIKLRNGDTVRGRLMTVTDTALSITGKNNRTETLDRNDVFQVYQLKRKSEKTKYALIGAGVGAAAGGGIGAAKSSGASDDGGIYVVGGIPIGAGIGALVGLLIGQGRRKKVLIYQAT